MNIRTAKVSTKLGHAMFIPKINQSYIGLFTQFSLEKQYKDALSDNKVVVFVRDNEQETLV